MKTMIVVALCMAVTNAYLEVKVDNVHASGNDGRICGTDAKADQAPWQISLVISGVFGDSHICGGSLIGSKTVLTAAHCCDGLSASSLKVKYGGLDRTSLATTNPVSKVTIHPNWNTNTYDSDYCILTLQDTVQETTNVKLIQVADQSPATGAKAYLTGWGNTFCSTSTLSIKLQYAPMEILSAADCKAKWADVNPITTNMICAQSKTASGCNGDFGGPLVVDGKLVGVVSWGDKGCPQDTTVRPTVYADPAAKAWISQNTQ